MSAPETALMPLAPSFVVTPQEIQKRLEELQAFVKGYMVPGEDYGTIPGTQKPTLYKPGAEKLCDVYGFTKEIQVLEQLEDWDRGRFAYTVKAVLRNKRTGLVEAEGVGQCNSLEAKYRWTWVWPDAVPAHLDKQTLQTRRTKRGGIQYRIPNDDPYSQVNTILKMAKKRALIDAVLSATRSSGLFTQDLEDLKANGVLPEPEAEASAETVVAATRVDRPPSRKASTPPPAPDATEKQFARLYAGLMADGVTQGELNDVVAEETRGKQRADWSPAEWQAVIDRLRKMRDALAPMDPPEGGKEDA